jgi:hypothetical protein
MNARGCSLCSKLTNKAAAFVPDHLARPQLRRKLEKKQGMIKPLLLPHQRFSM